MSLVALIDEVMQGLAGVMRKIAIDGDPSAVVYILLENIARKTGTKDEELILDLLLVDHDILCPKLVL